MASVCRGEGWSGNREMSKLKEKVYFRSKLLILSGAKERERKSNQGNII